MSLTSYDSRLQGKANIPSPKPIILGIESSCDETAAAVLTRSDNGRIDILSSIIASQDKHHAPFGGVVPEIAARAHVNKIDDIIDAAMTAAGLSFTDIDAVAATSGPGLIGGVITGLLSAKGIATALGVPLIGVNHLEGHALSPRLSHLCPFPYLLLLVSGGHTQLLSVRSLGQYERLGSTVDDALGEAFDKTAKVMDLGFPGGPKVEQIALNGDPTAISLPRPFKGTGHANFSFAGLKTAVARAFDKSDRSDKSIADICASFQAAACDVLAERTAIAMGSFDEVSLPGDRRLVVAGGVASNKTIRASLDNLCQSKGYSLIAPPLKFCTDNAAMIALAGLEHYEAGHQDNLTLRARPRWPLDKLSASKNPASGFGKKGPKS